MGEAQPPAAAATPWARSRVAEVARELGALRDILRTAQGLVPFPLSHPRGPATQALSSDSGSFHAVALGPAPAACLGQGLGATLRPSSFSWPWFMPRDLA